MYRQVAYTFFSLFLHFYIHLYIVLYPFKAKLANKAEAQCIEKLSDAQQVNRKKQTKNVLSKMRKIAGIKVSSDEQILHAYLVKTLSNA